MQPVDPSTLLDIWPERERQWARELGRIRFDQGPLSDQLEKQKRVTWVLTAVTGWIAFLILALFTAFKHPGIGAIVSGVIFGPIILLAWLDFRKLEGRARAYLREKALVEADTKVKSTGIDPEFS